MCTDRESANDDCAHPDVADVDGRGHGMTSDHVFMHVSSNLLAHKYKYCCQTPTSKYTACCTVVMSAYRTRQSLSEFVHSAFCKIKSPSASAGLQQAPDTILENSTVELWVIAVVSLPKSRTLGLGCSRFDSDAADSYWGNILQSAVSDAKCRQELLASLLQLCPTTCTHCFTE